MADFYRPAALAMGVILSLTYPAVSLAAPFRHKIDPMDAQMEGEIAHLKAEQAHLEFQMHLAKQIATMTMRIDRMRLQLMRTLQAEGTPMPAAYAGNGASPDYPQPSPINNRPSYPQPVRPVNAQPLAGSQSPTRYSAPVSSSVPLSTQNDTAFLPYPAPQSPVENVDQPALTPAPASSPLSAPSVFADERTHIREQIARIKSEISPWVGGAVGYRSRTGISGLSRLNETDATAGASDVIGNVGRVTVRATHVQLSASGTPTLADAFPNLVSNQTALGTSPYPIFTSANGTALSLGFTRPGFRAAIGTSPLGFLVQGLTGRIRWRPGNGPAAIELYRQSVRDSLLSYAGAKLNGGPFGSPADSIWGGVFSNGLQVSFGTGKRKLVYGALSYAVLEGTNVASNRRWSVDGGVRWPIATGDPDQHLHLGVNLLFMSYNNNLSFFTYGQGGYFSPESFYRPAVTLQWNGRIDRNNSWALGGSLGWQSFHQAASPYFPIDPAVQAAAGNPYFAAQNNSSVAYSAEGRVASLLDPHWLGGGWFRVDNSRNYENAVIGLYLQYYFNRLQSVPVFNHIAQRWTGVH